MPESKSKNTEVTVRGVTLNIDPQIFDDLEMLDFLDQLEQGNGLRLASVVRAVAGDKYSDVVESLRDSETKRVPLKVAGEWFVEVMREANPNS